MEQRLATGESSDGAKINFKDILKEVSAMVKDAQFSRQSSSRLLVVLMVTQGGQLSKEKREELLHAAGLETEENAIIDNLALLGVSVEKAKGGKMAQTKKAAPSQGRGQGRGLRAVPLRDPGEADRRRDAEGDAERERLSVDPRAAVGAAKTRGGSQRQFPYRAAPPKFTTTLGKGTVTSDKLLDLGHDKKIPLVAGGRVVVFLLGSITDGEVRGVYELIKITTGNHCWLHEHDDPNRAHGAACRADGVGCQRATGARVRLSRRALLQRKVSRRFCHLFC